MLSSRNQPHASLLVCGVSTARTDSEARDDHGKEATGTGHHVGNARQVDETRRESGADGGSQHKQRMWLEVLPAAGHLDEGACRKQLRQSTAIHSRSAHCKRCTERASTRVHAVCAWHAHCAWRAHCSLPLRHRCTSPDTRSPTLQIGPATWRHSCRDHHLSHEEKPKTRARRSF